MLDDETIRAAARQLMTARAARAPYQPLEVGRRGAPLEDAYRIQDALHELVTAEGGGALAGYKIALTSKAMQEMVGVDQPLAGAVLASAVHRAPARVSLAPFQHLGVEFEVAVQLGADLPASTRAHTRESVGAAVAACMPAFELVEDRRADYRTIDAFSLAAENCWNAGVVLGPASGDWRRLSLEAAPTRLWINEAPAGEGRAGDALGHPFEAVAWLANLLNRRGRMLRRDMFVMTGSSITTKFPAAGDVLRFAIDDLGEVTLELTA
jgi:2-keto-4-pentenoate hydratase